MTGRPRSAFNAPVHGARGLFALMVFVYHVVHSGLPGLLGADSLFDRYFLHSFQFGVELFFGISGFVILGALRRSPSMRSFVWDRFTRIYPLLWLTLIAITIAAVVGGLWQPPLVDWLLNFLAPPPFFPLAMVNPAAWSLGYEITFYLLCAFCWWLRQRGGHAWLVVALAVGTVLLVLFPRAALMPAGLLIAAGILGRFKLLRWLSTWRAAATS
jgi:peptidoglycan/LPS O-acetylase OafA/YrhL